ncbi:MFS transporter [Paenibacillus psychroresistens]|uniref:MFS transporter n=1 Tax=Paenibacillus psychroresistens TaxID=1778678 RepID=A0A6B8RLQ8_9BACL|nr:MFS transporter [Paenibacillus psychroresistens]QGQ97331.1 MFS transporter [Paenibacillus psychroresistens]
MHQNRVIYLLSFGGFVMGTAEIIVAGILGMIVKDLNVSVGLAGQLVSIYAAVFAIGSPILISLTAKVERRKLLLLSFAVFIIGNLIAYFSPNFTVLIVSRIVLASSASIFTVVALTVGSNLVAPEKRGNAIGIIIMGFSTSLVVGAPLGTLIGEYWGWRSVFIFIAILAVFAMIGIYAFIPKLAGQEPVSFKAQFKVLKNKRIISGLLITFFWMIGYQLMFTYISPFLQNSAGLNTNMISAALLVCGIFAVVGSRAGGYGADKWGINRTLIFSLLFHAVALAILPWVAATLIGAFFILAVWIGSAWTTTPALQYYLVSLSPKSPDLALGLNNSVLQLGVAAGAAMGGWVVYQFSVISLGWVGAIAIIFGLFAALYSFSVKKAIEI